MTDPLRAEAASGGPRRNRVDPWGDLFAVPDRGLFTGNRGCLVTDDGSTVRHHNGTLWIICRTSFRGWSHPLNAPRTWTPLFFLDDAAALAAGHRPCGLCRREDHLSYRSAVTAASGRDKPILALELNRRLSKERLKRGRGLERANDRLTWTTDIDQLPTGTVVLTGRSGHPHLVTDDHIRPFAFSGWGGPRPRPTGSPVEVLTPPTSVQALRHGFEPTLHPSVEPAR